MKLRENKFYSLIMPKLYKSSSNYNFTTKFRNDGDKGQTVDVSHKRRSSPNTRFNGKNNELSSVNKDDILSPTKWLSKQMLESSQNELEVCSKSSMSIKNESSIKSPSQNKYKRSINKMDTEQNRSKNTNEGSTTMPSTETLSKDILKKCFSNKYKNYRNNAIVSSINKSSKVKTGEYLSISSLIMSNYRV